MNFVNSPFTVSIEGVEIWEDWAGEMDDLDLRWAKAFVRIDCRINCLEKSSDKKIRKICPFIFKKIEPLRIFLVTYFKINIPSVLMKNCIDQRFCLDKVHIIFCNQCTGRRCHDMNEGFCTRNLGRIPIQDFATWADFRINYRSHLNNKLQRRKKISIIFIIFHIFINIKLTIIFIWSSRVNFPQKTTRSPSLNTSLYSSWVFMNCLIIKGWFSFVDLFL